MSEKADFFEKHKDKVQGIVFNADERDSLGYLLTLVNFSEKEFKTIIRSSRRIRFWFNRKKYLEYVTNRILEKLQDDEEGELLIEFIMNYEIWSSVSRLAGEITSFS